MAVYVCLQEEGVLGSKAELHPGIRPLCVHCVSSSCCWSWCMYGIHDLCLGMSLCLCFSRPLREAGSFFPTQ